MFNNICYLAFLALAGLLEANTLAAAGAGATGGVVSTGAATPLATAKLCKSL